MSSAPELLYATPCERGVYGLTIDRATSVANRVLSENGMADFKTTKDHARTWKDYIIFRYFNAANPSLAHGGGATLVVRTSDMLGGMVYCSFDWLEQDIDRLFANIPAAFLAYDAKEF